MSHIDWDPDELLNFDYSSPVPERTSTRVSRSQMAESAQNKIERAESIDDAIKFEEDRARKLQEEYERIRSAARAQRENSVIEEIPRAPKAATPEQLQADSAVQAEAYRRFRDEYADKKPVSRKTAKSAERKAGSSGRAFRKGGAAAAKVSGFYKFTKVLCLPYIIALAAFTIAMTIMNVLPFFWLVAMFIVLGLLSLIIITQLSKNNIKKWAKVLATTMAVVLIVFYGVGTAYAMGTLSFLEKTSVKNDDKVGAISKEPFIVAMTGMDVRGTVDEQGRSDVNMIVAVNPNTETILMTSIPRDYEIRMPDKGYATDKLTHTGFYSVDTTMQAEEDLLDININYYVKVNFTTVMMFVDAIGGIDVYSEYEFNPVKRDWWTVKQGWNHMNGRQALAFARERHAFLDGDNQRIKNQQAVFEAMLKKATSSKTIVLSYNKILSSMDDYFEMSFSSGEIRSLVRMQLAKNPKWKIFKNTLEGSGATKPTYTMGSQPLYVMEPLSYSVDNGKALIQAVMDGKKLDKDEDGNVIIAEESSESETASEDAA